MPLFISHTIIFKSYTSVICMELSTQMAGIVELFLLTFFFGIHFILPHLKLKS